MKDILLKRNELRRNSINLRTIKFDESVNEKDIENLIKEQDKVYKKYKFYDRMVKMLNNKKEH